MNITDIMEIIKPIKSECVVTDGNLVIGSDRFFNTLRIITFDNIFPVMAFDWNLVVYNIKNEIPYNLNDVFILNNIRNKLEVVNHIKCTINPKVYKDMQQNEDFLGCLSKKAMEGASKFKIDENYYIYIWNGLLNKNKSDKVDILIYDLDCSTFLAEFIIYKKKNLVVHQYIKYFKI